MKRTCLSIFLSLCITLTLSAAGTFDVAYAAQNGFESENSMGLPQGTAHNLTGKITDIITAAGITYVEVDTGKEKVWAAGTTGDSLDTGDTISFSTAMAMENFHSKSLNRDFAVIYFVKQFISGDQVPGKIAPSGQTGKP
ncbi:MAG: hypothetical protein JSW45_13380, partial [Thiotrichales bacterium]